MTKPRKTLLLRFDRALSKSLLRQIGILAGILLGAMLISMLFLSFSKTQWVNFCHENKISPFMLPFYLLIDQDIFNNLYYNNGAVKGWMLIACGLTYIFGVIIFNGMLVGLIVNAISERVENYRNGLTHYLNSGHYVIMGYDDMVPSIIEDIFLKNKDADVLLLTSMDSKSINERLKKSVAKSQLDSIIVNYGHKMAGEYYGDIHLESAKEIYIVGRRKLPEHDAVNIECVDSICNYLKDHKSDQMPKRITCVFEDLDTYAAFKTSEIFSEVGELGIEFVPYNFYAGWAKQVFLTRSYKEKSKPTDPIPYPSVYGDGIGLDDERFVHLVFVGTTNFAVSFAMEAAHMLHFPNFNEESKKPKTRITFIEQNAEKEMLQFITRNRHFFDVQSYIYEDLSLEPKPLPAQKKKDDFLDVEFEFIRGDVYSDVIQNLISKWARDTKQQYLSIFLAQTDQRCNFMMGMNMPDEVYYNAIPVFIRQDRADNFVTNLRKADNKESNYSVVKDGELETTKRKGLYAHLYPFGMDDMAYCSDETSLHRAKLINFLYNTADYNCNKFKDPIELAAMGTDHIWEKANEEWKKLSVAKKWSNLYCAYSIPCKLASLRVMRGLKPDDTSRDQQSLTEDEIQQIAIVEHNRWNVEKLLMGYRKAAKSEDRYEHPEFKDSLKKNKELFIHHDIRPFEELPDFTKQLDAEIVKYIPWILKMTEE